MRVSRPGQVGTHQTMGLRTECAFERYDIRNPSARHLKRGARITQALDYDIIWARSEADEKTLYGEKWRPRVSAIELNKLRRLEILEQADR